jgi:hypothetical protein
MSAKIIEKLPMMSPPETLQVWRNALRILARDPGNVAAQAVLDAVGREWDRRGPVEVFAWPGTHIVIKGGARQFTTEDWEKEGLLRAMGYQVGQGQGGDERFRRLLLCQVFEGPVPAIGSRAYIAGWGQPNSVARLKKMADSIASFVCNAKRKRTAALQVAIEDWEGDLQYLHDRYYRPDLPFGWPDTAI